MCVHLAHGLKREISFPMTCHSPNDTPQSLSFRGLILACSQCTGHWLRKTPRCWTAQPALPRGAPSGATGPGLQGVVATAVSGASSPSLRAVLVLPGLERGAGAQIPQRQLQGLVTSPPRPLRGSLISAIAFLAENAEAEEVLKTAPVGVSAAPRKELSVPVVTVTDWEPQHAPSSSTASQQVCVRRGFHRLMGGGQLHLLRPLLILCCPGRTVQFNRQAHQAWPPLFSSSLPSAACTQDLSLRFLSCRCLWLPGLLVRKLSCIGISREPWSVQVPRLQG